MEENKNPSSHLKARWQNALNVQHKEIYICIILPEAFDVSDIDQCARNLSCHANANCTDTIGSHLCTCHTGYTGDGQTCLGDFNKFPSMFRKVLYDQRGAILLLLFLYIQSQLFEAGSNLKRPFNSYYGAGSNQIFILKCSSTEHSIVGCDVVRLIPIWQRRVFKTEYLRWARLLQ